MGTLGSHVCRGDQNLPRQLILEVDIPLVINGCLWVEILAGHARQRSIEGIQRRESRCQRQRGRYAVAVKCRLVEKWEIVVKLQRIAGANFVKDKEPAVSRSNHQRFGGKGAVG